MKAYYYLFYKLYKFWEQLSIPKFWSDAKALFSILTLKVFIIIPLTVYYKFFINKNSNLLKEKWLYIFVGALFFFADYFLFLHKDKWKQIVHKYDKWPETKNNTGSILVAVFILV